MVDQVIELRQYTLKPGTRPGFIERFEREFLETQEAVGMEVTGTFLDLDDPDRFVWFRAFPSYEARAVALAAFYDGPVWAEWSVETNADLIDSDDVLMLRPAPGFAALPAGPLSEAAIHVWAVSSNDEERALLDALSGVSSAGVLRSHPGPNNFPRLPVRDGRVVILIASGPVTVPDGEIQRLRLAPTTRSALR
jgi:hypothetical protein